jgi:hypothetical protein
MVGGGYLGSVGSAQAGDEPANNVGSSGSDGQNVTCNAYMSPPKDVLTCKVVGGGGEDGAPGAVRH